MGGSSGQPTSATAPPLRPPHPCAELLCSAPVMDRQPLGCVNHLWVTCSWAWTKAPGSGVTGDLVDLLKGPCAMQPHPLCSFLSSLSHCFQNGGLSTPKCVSSASFLMDSSVLEAFSLLIFNCVSHGKSCWSSPLGSEQLQLSVPRPPLHGFLSQSTGMRSESSL